MSLTPPDFECLETVGPDDWNPSASTSTFSSTWRRIGEMLHRNDPCSSQTASLRAPTWKSGELLRTPAEEPQHPSGPAASQKPARWNINITLLQYLGSISSGLPQGKPPLPSPPPPSPSPGPKTSLSRHRTGFWWFRSSRWGPLGAAGGCLLHHDWPLLD